MGVLLKVKQTANTSLCHIQFIHKFIIVYQVSKYMCQTFSYSMLVSKPNSLKCLALILNANVNT